MDDLIIDAVNLGLFSVDVLYSNTVRQTYVERGFTITRSQNGTMMNISWTYPTISQLDIQQYRHSATLVNFRAVDVYLNMTHGRDIKHLTPRVVKNMILNREDVFMTYSLNNTTVINMYSNILVELLHSNVVIFIHSGVLSRVPYYYDSLQLNLDNQGRINTLPVDPSEIDDIVTGDDDTIYGQSEW